MEDWLGELDNIRREDEKRRKREKIDLSVIEGNDDDGAMRLLKQVDALNVLRRANPVLLSKKGYIAFCDDAKLISYLGNAKYDHCACMVWQGSISEARSPSLDDPSPFYYILVGVRGDKAYVNGKALRANTPDALKAAVVVAARKPGVQKRK